MSARFAPLLAVMLLTLLFAWLIAEPTEEPLTETAVRPVPAITYTDLDGKTITLPPQQWVLVNFFASWCVPCVLEHPQLMELKDTFAVVGIAYKDQTAAVRTLLKQRGNPYTYVLTDPAGVAALAYGISGVPESFLINPKGEIIWHFSGPLMPTQIDEIKILLQGPTYKANQWSSTREKY